MEIIPEIIDLLSLCGFVWVLYRTNARRRGSWWKLGLASLIIGGSLGYALWHVFPSFDVDFFPILMTFLVSLVGRPIVFRYM